MVSMADAKQGNFQKWRSGFGESLGFDSTSSMELAEGEVLQVPFLNLWNGFLILGTALGAFKFSYTIPSEFAGILVFVCCSPALRLSIHV